MAPQPGTILRRIKQEKILRVRTRRLYLGRAHWTFGSPPPRRLRLWLKAAIARAENVTIYRREGSGSVLTDERGSYPITPPRLSCSR
jgi:hypothetical protein